MTVDLSHVYELIAPDLERATRIFRAELASEHALLDELAAHVDRYRGKQLRPALVFLTAQACGGIRAEHDTLAAVVEMVHIATLVHDDVLDEADVRRRSPTVNRTYGNEQAVLFGDFLFSHAYHLCSSLESQFAARLIGRTAATLCEGELLQVANRDNFALGEERYFEIIDRKTAALIAACALLGARYAGADEATCRQMHQYGRSLGLAFQIVDDLLDITGIEAEVGKSLGRDVQKGKLTLPLIHYLKTQPAARREAALALLNGNDPQRHAHVARLLADSDSLAHAASVAQEHVQLAVRALDGLPESDARAALRAMAEFVTARRY